MKQLKTVQVGNNKYYWCNNEFIIEDYYNLIDKEKFNNKKDSNNYNEYIKDIVNNYSYNTIVKFNLNSFYNVCKHIDNLIEVSKSVFKINSDNKLEFISYDKNFGEIYIRYDLYKHDFSGSLDNEFIFNAGELMELLKFIPKKYKLLTGDCTFKIVSYDKPVLIECKNDLKIWFKPTLF